MSPFARRRDFCYVSQVAGFNMRRVSPAHSAPVLTPLLARPAQCTPSRSPSTCYFTGGSPTIAAPLSLTGGRAAVEVA